LARAGLAAARRQIAAGHDFDLIDAHYVYPDGVAAWEIGKALGKPVLITARGSDINVLTKFSLPRSLIVEALGRCAKVIAVSAALKEAMAAFGVARERIEVLRNGVDLQLFQPEERDAARASVGVRGFTIASVGNLIPDKGHHLVIEALRGLPDVELVIAGRGGEEARLRALAEGLGVGDRVKFLGAVPQARLRTLYSAADCLVLASERAGGPNVLLEAMACGTPVVASRVGGVPEIVGDDAVGVIMDDLSAGAVQRAIARLRSALPDRNRVRAYAERFSWDATTSGQLSVFKGALDRSAREARRA
jgi:glycosyltransferase involved in cell wall biosynthesis